MPLLDICILLAGTLNFCASSKASWSWPWKNRSPGGRRSCRPFLVGMMVLKGPENLDSPWFEGEEVVPDCNYHSALEMQRPMSIDSQLGQRSSLPSHKRKLCTDSPARSTRSLLPTGTIDFKDADQVKSKADPCAVPLAAHWRFPWEPRSRFTT